jgi:hypothetical protein
MEFREFQKNTNKVLVFNSNSKLVSIINMKNNNENTGQFTSLLPKIFDGSIFSDSQEIISDDSSDYFKNY